jgi:AFG3 family protein
VDRPDLSGRVEIFRVHLRKLTLAVPAATIAERIAQLTPGFTGADIANVCNEGAYKNSSSVTVARTDARGALQRR